MKKLKDLYLRLCMTALFSKVTEKPVFSHFERVVREEAREEKIKAYAAFVGEIYSSRLSLSELVKKYVFEDENVYIKSAAHELAISPSVISALKTELSALSDFASLCVDDFVRALEIDTLLPFDSEKTDIYLEYRDRVKNVSRYGYGIFSASPMFRLTDAGTIEPIMSADKTTVDKFIGYKEEREAVLRNTEAFVEGRPAANTLLCGDAGTGKSSTVKAIANHFFDRGIRLIELRKDQLKMLPEVMGKVSENPLKFIIFIDDLAFNKSDDNFSMLKAALEGSASAKADNAVIYATSNRRHIIKESFSDRDGDDVHRNDSMQETLSLSERFGLVVSFTKPNKQLYLEIVHALAERFEISIPASELDVRAEAFALKKGSRSARCAEQFIDSLL